MSAIAAEAGRLSTLDRLLLRIAERIERRLELRLAQMRARQADACHEAIVSYAERRQDARAAGTIGILPR
ncbi:hypothetical protein GCM10009808_06400 [Microbacterium sediminicola]|uniref:Uncharacterized protein n=1 Tax=Microbacterium sediminicola TaxID=415210 RepID=A0ABN2HQX9_9MICO